MHSEQGPSTSQYNQQRQTFHTIAVSKSKQKTIGSLISILFIPSREIP